MGIGDDTAVVAYDDVSGSIAARLWWMLDAIGHAVALLDGGLAAWTGPRATGPAPGPACGHHLRASILGRRSGWWVPTTCTPRSTLRVGVVLDARLGERYRGEVEPIDPVAGHIPGARSAPWADNLDPSTGRFLPSYQLRERYEARGVRSGDDAIVYCGSGLTATHDLLAMRLAGFPHDGRLYGGSWSGWIEDPTRPVATGSSACSADAPGDR